MRGVTLKMGMAAGLAVVALAAAYVAAQTAPATGQGATRAELMENERNNLELQLVPAFKAFDNLYYVGVGWVGSWLVTTTDAVRRPGPPGLSRCRGVADPGDAAGQRAGSPSPAGPDRRRSARRDRR